MPGVDHFPSTHGTWIGVRLDTIAEAERGPDDGGTRHTQAAQMRRELREHLMTRYARALTAYVSGADFSRIGEPDDLVGGFFARVLPQEDFLERWRKSGMPLRRWLMNAMSFHCRGLMRNQARERDRTEPLDDLIAPIDGVARPQHAAGPDGEAERAFERAWALSIVNEAYARVQQSLHGEGRMQDDAILRMHVLDGMTYEHIAQAMGLSRQDCFNAVRRIMPRVRAALRDLLSAEGIPEPDMPATLQHLMRLLSRQ